MTAPVTMSSEKIAMTAPVTMSSEKSAMTAPVTMASSNNESAEKTSVLMSFILPSKYKTVAETPVPTDERVHLEQVPGALFAVTTFSGFYRYPSEALSIAEKFIAQLQKD